MTEEGDGKVIDIRMRLAQQRQQQGRTDTTDSTLKAADVLTKAIAELATQMPATDLYAGILLAVKATNVILEHAVGAGHLKQIEEDAKKKAETYTMRAPVHYKGPTVFDGEKD